jgi:hypothetical protein
MTWETRIKPRHPRYPIYLYHPRYCWFNPLKYLASIFVLVIYPQAYPLILACSTHGSHMFQILIYHIYIYIDPLMYSMFLYVPCSPHHIGSASIISIQGPPVVPPWLMHWSRVRTCIAGLDCPTCHRDDGDGDGPRDADHGIPFQESLAELG